MPQNDLITPWLTILAQWLPPKHVVHIGANLPDIYMNLDAVPLWVVDFDGHKKVQAQQQFSAAPLHFLAQAVAEHTGPAVWHQASNAAESGLLPPEQLRHYWQNLKTIATQPVEVSSLDSVLTTQQIQPGWIWVDCFPALAILRGATNALAQTNVVVARVIITDPNAPADTSLAAVQAFMQCHGFVLASVQPERHPAIGTAVFFRDFAHLAAQRQAELDAQRLKTGEIKEYLSKQTLAQQQKAQEASKTIAAIELEKAQLKTEKDALQTAHDALTAEKAQLSSVRNAESKAKTEALAARDAQGKQTEERTAQVQQLTHAKAAADKLAVERQQLIDQLQAQAKKVTEQIKATVQAAEKDKEAAAAAIAANAANTKQAEERAAQIQQLTQAKAALQSKLEAVTKDNSDLQVKLQAEAQGKTDTLQKLQQQTQTVKTLQTKLDSEGKALSESWDKAEQLRQDTATLQTQKDAENKEKMLLQEKYSKVLHDLSLYKEWETFEDIQAKKYQATAVQSLMRASKDDDVDEFLTDIQPFFIGKSITYVDIGACTGDVYAKLIGLNKIKVREAHLIEPNSENFTALQAKHASLLKARQSNIYNMAIHTTMSECVILKSGSMSTITNSGTRVENNKTEIVMATTLSEISKNITDRKIHLLKIDTEGREMEVLESGVELFAEGLIDVIYIEVGFNAKSTQQTYFCKVDEFMSRYDYRVFGLYEAVHEWIDDVPLLRRCNMAYMRRSFASAHPCRLIKAMLNP